MYGLCVSCADLDCRKVEFGKLYLEVAALSVNFTDSAVFSGILATACFPRKAVRAIVCLYFHSFLSLLLCKLVIA